eukprot:3640113-Rhodomonas_salina.1
MCGHQVRALRRNEGLLRAAQKGTVPLNFFTVGLALLPSVPPRPPPLLPHVDLHGLSRPSLTGSPPAPSILLLYLPLPLIFQILALLTSPLMSFLPPFLRALRLTLL